MDISSVPLDARDRRLVEAFQRDLPVCPEPYRAMADRLGVSEDVVQARLGRLEALGVVSRIGAVVAPHRAGWSTLAAMAVPPERLEQVADHVSSYPGVNHNYERQHRLNLWSVVTARSRWRVRGVLEQIAGSTGIEVIDLPLERAYGIDLGFKPSWI